MEKIRCNCILLGCTLLLGSLSAQGFTLEQVLGAPFPSSLVVSASGSRVAWVFNSRGRRNIWVAEGPDFRARQLSAYHADDGRGLSLIGFSADAGQILFVRDFRFNPAHEIPAGRGRHLYWIDWKGGEPHEIAPTWVAAPSPRAAQVAYVEGQDVKLVAMKVGARARRLFSLRGRLGGLRWSPDGRRLLLTSSRGTFPHRYSYLVLFDLEEGHIRYLDASIYQDSSGVWSPDGSRIAFLRRLTSGHRFSLVARQFPRKDPWQVRVVELKTGQVEVAWQSPPEGNFPAAALDWLDNNQIVFTSEKEGFRHLYRVSREGGEVQPITSGHSEVEAFRVNRKTGRLLWVSNARDVDRRHLWSAGRDGRARPLTSGASIEWSPRLSGDGRSLVYLGSDARWPAGVYVRPLAGGDPVRLAPQSMPADFPLPQLVEPRQAVFHAADGLTIHGMLFLPPERYRGRRPAILHFHGGPIRQMLLGWHYRGYYHNAYAMNQYLASRGYVVLTVNYRLGIGYGRAFRDVPNGGPRGGTEYLDLLAAARYLRGLKRVDPERMGLWGGSYGGLMTALGLARNSDLFAAGVDMHGVHDWNQWQAWAAHRADDNNRLAWKSSPIADLDSWRSPVLFIHGDDDRNVPFSETVWLFQELKRRGVECELLIFPDEVHGFLLYRSWLRAYRAAARFFDRKLGGEH